jgi:redox-sensitive bicupin YhaK (pirin superfamily)
MEIITEVLEGALEHRESMGNGSAIRPGEVQRMSAGTGILHSEMNGSATESVHLFQVWILPERQGITPSYEQRAFDPEESHNRWRILASRDGRDGSVTIHQDARLLQANLDAGTTVRHAIAPGRHAWLQVASGTVMVDGQVLEAGDGASLSDVSSLTVEARDASSLLLFDLA